VVVDVSVASDDADRVTDAARQLDHDTDVGETDLLDANPLLRAMSAVAERYGVSVTLSVYPPAAALDDGDDDDGDGDDNGNEETNA
jgi:hypothetical protein